jgi:hypothetical protein
MRRTFLEVAASASPARRCWGLRAAASRRARARTPVGSSTEATSAVFSQVSYVQYRLRLVEAAPSRPLFITKDDAEVILALSDYGIHQK